MRRSRLTILLSLALVGVGVYPSLQSWRETRRMTARLEAVAPGKSPRSSILSVPLMTADLALLLRVSEVEPWLASWQSIGGCGAGSGSGSAAGLKWIGRNVTGGLFNVQEQVSYSDLGSKQYPEHNLFVNTLITRDIGEKWNVGVNVPFVYKRLGDPLHLAPDSPAVDYTNAGLGDVSLLATAKLGRINATTLTGVVGLPTGTWNATYFPGKYLNQSAQLGFGKVTASLIADHVMDQVWGLIVVGGVGAYRGGENKINSYRAPSATGYAYAGYFWGRFVPAFGLSLSTVAPTIPLETHPKYHDIDVNAEQYTPIASLAANASVEWSTDWIALLVAVSVPYKYDGLYVNDSGVARSPWGFMPWSVAFGVAASPF